MLFILLIVIFIAGAVWAEKEWHEGLLILCTLGVVFTLVAWIVTLCETTDCHFGEDTYTGYIYSVTKSGFGKRTAGHLRFSESAGGDSQPSFCVKEEDADYLRSLAGSGKKVRVTIPDAGFVRGEMFTCIIPATVEEVE